MGEEWQAVWSPVAEYVVYDPPVLGLPYLAVLLTPDERPRVFIFATQEEAAQFLKSNAIEPLPLKSSVDR